MTKDITAMGGYCIQVVVLLYLRCCPSRDRHTETQTERQAQAKPGRHDNQLHRGTCRWTMNTMANGWQKREKHCCGKKQCDAKTQTDRQTDRQTDKWMANRSNRGKSSSRGRVHGHGSCKPAAPEFQHRWCRSAVSLDGTPLLPLPHKHFCALESTAIPGSNCQCTL